MKLLIDFESRSRADLPATGQHIYARHPSTEVMCLGWKIINEGEAKVLTMPGIYTDDPSETKEFKYAVKHAEFVVAHNAPFEQAMWKHCLLPTTTLGASLPYLPPEKWLCTLSMASILALPRGLENVGNALNLKIKKDVEARKLLLRMCKPRAPIQNIKAWIEWVETDDALKRLYEYCRTDIATEEALFNELTKYKIFTKKERELWVLDQKINQRGFYIDKPMVENILRLIEQEESELSKELHRKTFYQVATVKQTKAFREFLLSQGFDIPNMQKATIDATIELLEKENKPANSDVLDVLKIRQSLGMSSTSKYQAFLERADDDNRVRDNLMFHGASTGRWAGTGVQPQNFPRGRVKMTQEIFSDIAEGDLHWLRLLYGRPMDLFSSALRGVIRATPGFDLFCGDFSSIEARVLLWLAGDKAGLDEYEKGVDAYRSMASVIYQIPIEQIDDDQRFLGKSVILGCGYQMGKKKFAETVKASGKDLPDSIIHRAHDAFREKHPLVPKVWSNYENAAIYAVQNKGKRIKINKVAWYVEKDFLFAELPSGRRLAYYKPQIRNEETPWGELRPKLYVWTTDSKTKQWVQRAVYGGLLTENISQAVSRDCMVEAMFRTEAAGYKILITVHDELLNEKEEGTGKLEEFTALMSARPDWAPDLPLKVGAWTGKQYKK